MSTAAHLAGGAADRGAEFMAQTQHSALAAAASDRATTADFARQAPWPGGQNMPSMPGPHWQRYRRQVNERTSSMPAHSSGAQVLRPVAASPSDRPTKQGAGGAGPRPGPPPIPSSPPPLYSEVAGAAGMDAGGMGSHRETAPVRMPGMGPK